MAGLNALSGSSNVNAPKAGGPAAAAPERGPTIARDGLALSRQASAPFSAKAAGQHFLHGLWAEGKDMLLSLWHHPIASLGVTALGGAAIAAAPLIGLSSATAGMVLAGGFALYGAYRILGSAFKAYGDAHAGRAREAEADFEEMGRGGFDIVTAAGPTIVEEGLALIRHARLGATAAEGLAVVEATSAVETAAVGPAATRGSLKEAFMRAALLADDFLGWIAQGLKKTEKKAEPKKEAERR